MTSRGKTTPASTQGSWKPHTGDRSRVTLDTDNDRADQWAELFDKNARAQLTRHGITPDEWLEAGQAAGQYGHHLLIEAHREGLTPEQTRAVLRVVHHKQDALYKAGEKNIDPAYLDTIPDALCPMYLNEIESLPTDPTLLARYAEAAQHDLHANSKRPLRLGWTHPARIDGIARIVAADITPEYAAATGSGDDWHRAALIRETGLDPALAARWPMLYPKSIPAIEAGGWEPTDLTTDTIYHIDGWAEAGHNATTQREWAAAGIPEQRLAAPYIAHGITPAEASEWQALPWEKIGAPPVHAYLEAGITASQAAAAANVGLAIGHAHDIVANNTTEQIGAWVDTLTQDHARPMPADRIRAWNAAGFQHANEVQPWIAAIAPQPRMAKTVTVPMIRYAREHGIQPEQLTRGAHPAALAVAAATGADLTKLLAAPDPVEAARTALRRRKLDVPF